jgi:hypothetical protein
MNDFITSLIRSYVPLIVGAVAAFFTSRNVKVDAQSLAGLTAALSGLFYGLYYGIVRLFEKYVSPKFGWFLGYAKSPVYPTEKDTTQK